MSLPAADALFGRDQQDRPDGQPVVRAVPDSAPDRGAGGTGVTERPAPGHGGRSEVRAGHRTSGRVKHDEKMTVYVTSAELLALERARLSLRAEHGLAVDRGRLVREAVALVLADLHERGDVSALVRRLTED